jgi:hypothetical protein
MELATGFWSFKTLASAYEMNREGLPQLPHLAAARRHAI